jgi:signal transduction histidine kinase
VAEGTRGAYTSTTGELSHFIARRVQGSSMHLALTAPDDRLYASVSGAGRWLPWVLLLALVGAAAVALLALRASNRRGEALAAANAAKTRFLASASHELRTPLNGIIGFSQLLYDGKLGELDEVQREATKDILTSGEHLNRLVGSLLDITRAETGRLEIHPESVDLGELVDDVRAGLQTVAEDKGIVMGARVGDDLPGRVVVDPTRLRQVLLNYLSNALKFTPEGGRVSIEVTLENDEEFRVAVRDTGPGLSEEAIAKLFQRYERLHTTAAEGTGLGLAVTREIVEAHGGRTGVESTLGEGALFYATFPLETVAEHAATPS